VSSARRSPSGARLMRLRMRTSTSLKRSLRARRSRSPGGGSGISPQARRAAIGERRRRSRSQPTPEERGYAGCSEVLAAVLFALTGAAVLLASFPISEIVSGEGDSPDSTYIAVAGVELGFALLCAIGGALALRRL